MVVVAAAVMKLAPELLEGNLGFAFDMVVARDARERTAQRVLKVFLVFAYLMEVVADVRCNKGAEGSTPFYKGHGGGKRCSFRGGRVCPKSVHGGNFFCVAHAGGKRCVVPEFTKSARGRTDFCVHHGGGKRCKFEGCGKSAKGSINFCNAHGGGKRCSWGHPGSEFGQGDVPCNTLLGVKLDFALLLVLWFRIRGFMVVQL
ncbi:UNVERIFIED_CONTAM: hypothetical protein Slati_4328400 [Sesamum latifolium]|uniref:WRKY19-like zinc finger domain-containing protein n=1 Tax=Sesamum latifolium TaxID=2727402 RepID=A0AAW2SNK7_9LAMI